nr:histidine kinase [Pedobacter sp. MC2016-14]
MKFNAIIVSFLEDSRGRLWFGTNKNVLFMWDAKRLTKYAATSTSPQLTNSYLHEDEGGKIWAFNNLSVNIYTGAAFKTVPNTPLPISIKMMKGTAKGKLIYLSTDGLVLKSGTVNKILFKVPSKLLDNEPGYFHTDGNELWISNKSGVYKINSNGNVEHYLKGKPTSQIVKDNRENMWFTTLNGIYMLPKTENRMYLIDASSGLKCNAIKSVVKDRKNRLWLGMDNGDINVLDSNKKKKEIILSNKNKYNRIKELVVDTLHQALYFASDFGLGMISDIYSGKPDITYLNEIHGSKFVIKNFSVNKNKNLAIAMSSGVMVLRDAINPLNFSLSTSGPTQDYLENRAYTTFFDRKGSLWFSNIHGLHQFQKGNLISYYKKNTLFTKRINDIKELNDGTLILATDGYGIIFIKENRIIAQLTQKNGLANNICKKIFVKNDVIWVITNNGINRIRNNGDQKTIEAFEYTNVLLKTDVNDLYIDSDTAWFATNQGLVYFYNKKANQLNELPKVWISSIVANDQIFELNDPNILLQPSFNTIAFRYNAIDFQNQEMTFRYRLKANASWTITKNRRIEFSSLAPGQYKFELSAKSANSKWSTPQSVSFELQGYFWQRLWFLALLFLIIGIILIRVATIVTKNKKNKEQEKLLLKNKILMLEQRALQAMMNPHFIFNVMNSIQHYINTKDTSSANKVLTGFARLVRKNLEICTKSFITLEEEIEYLTLYLSLEKKRFGDKLEYSFKIDEAIDVEETLIPSMLLQPFVENAIWHGIMPKENGGTVTVEITIENKNYLLIQIMDNGIGISNSLSAKKNTHKSKGMSLTQERINLLNQIELNPIEISINQSGESGTIVSIHIPAE